MNGCDIRFRSLVECLHLNATLTVCVAKAKTTFLCFVLVVVAVAFAVFMFSHKNVAWPKLGPVRFANMNVEM